MSRYSLKISKSAFGEAHVVDDISYIEGSATYGLVPANFREFAATGGANTNFDGSIVFYEDL